MNISKRINCSMDQVVFKLLSLNGSNNFLGHPPNLEIDTSPIATFRVTIFFYRSEPKTKHPSSQISHLPLTRALKNP